MLNIEKYKDEILKKCDDIMRNSSESYCSKVLGRAIFEVACHYKYQKDNETIIEWTFREYTEPVLTDEARDYLKAIIEPVECTKISKHSQSSYTYELRIYYKNNYILIACSKGTKLYEYFKNMEDFKIYTPEELGL